MLRGHPRDPLPVRLGCAWTAPPLTISTRMEFEELNFVEADRLILQGCREAGGEIQLRLCVEGVEDECCRAIHAHAQTMVERGFLERLIISGTRSKMQGAALFVTFRARPVALALLEVLERAEAAEAKLGARERAA